METQRWRKGYASDVGTDILLDEDVTFEPRNVTVVNLHVGVALPSEIAGLIVPRSSAAKMGLFIATCPIDPGYTGDIHAMVYNGSKEVITYKAGESFCQLLAIKVIVNPCDVLADKVGTRGNNAFRSTGK